MGKVASSGVRLPELLGTLSLAVDLGLGQPMGHVARSCVIARRLADRMGAPDRDREALYYVTLLGWLGCIADSHQSAAWFGNDIDYRAGVYDRDLAPLPFLGYLLSRAGAGASVPRRAGRVAALVATGARSAQETLHAHCQVTTAVAQRLGIDDEACRLLDQIFARWDGKGLPKGLAGEDIGLPVRLWHVADVAEVHHRRSGVATAVEVVRSRRGTQFDPAVVDDLCRDPTPLFDGLDTEGRWQDLTEVEPGLCLPLSEADLDAALDAVGDWVDLKSPVFGGHSRGVAELCAAAAERAGMPLDDIRLVRRAGLVHDLGRVGVPNSIWDKTTPLDESELERVRLHSYYTERMLSRPARLAQIGAVAALAHERLDGSGYHRGLRADAMPMTARILAVADTYHAKQEPRPHRPALSAAQAAAHVTRQARDGRLDPAAVDAVLAAAGQRQTLAAPRPAGLTPREVEVLALLANGLTNRQVARRLGITPKTVGNHVERIYTKAGVSTRAAATLFAIEHGLLPHRASHD
ncbi:MAG: LuxR C-terminal-related transcriptional regulator [Intrasporangium sp.]|uniref:HD domain-containing phosphohydrolase n=1 Tax=Intrasporangium sp. TaxID=1925024 RepID=UPI00264763CC|nr:HD domain-containing phosphohydrolase [Intrasporangium sp.]MDN5797995.1 LuxR C-terminal-related transcriptional regulator [Intrasporangium sp.]